MRVGYVRLSKAGPPQAAQEEALAGAGLEVCSTFHQIYIDAAPEGDAKAEHRWPERTRAIEALCAGDELVISSPSRLGATLEDVLNAIRAIGARGAALVVASTGATYRCNPDAIALAEFAALAEREGVAERTQKMRDRKSELGAHAGPPVRLVKDSAEWEKAAALWADPTHSAKDVAAMTGVSVRTLYRTFGEKGASRFGGNMGGKPAKN